MKWLDLDQEKNHSHVFLRQKRAEGNTHTFTKSSRRMASRGRIGIAPFLT